MKKNLFLVALATLSLASCSNDDVLSLKKDEININVVGSNGSRASEIYSANNLHKEFYVSALYQDGETTKAYIAQDLMAYEDGKWVNKSDTRYWPEDENMALDFIASNVKYNLGNQLGIWGAQIDFTPATNVNEQVDFLYAVTKNQSRELSAVNGVNLNFRHALSQIVFNTEVTNKTLKVVIKDITIANIANTGIFKFGLSTQGSTEEQYVKNSMGVGNFNSIEKPIDIYVPGVGGKLNSTSFKVDFDDVTLKGNEEVTYSDLTNTNDALALMLVPHTNVWGETDKNDKSTYADSGKPYIIINCEIYNIGEKHIFDENGNPTRVEEYVPIHTGDFLMPIDVEWESGTKYLYTIVFEGGSEPIKFNLTVDDWFFAPVDNSVVVE